MSSESTVVQIPQAVDAKGVASSKPRSEMCAGDFSPAFHGRVIRTFGETFSVKQTAREMKIPARVVNEILHARDFVPRRPAASMPVPRLVRRIA